MLSSSSSSKLFMFVLSFFLLLDLEHAEYVFVIKNEVCSNKPTAQLKKINNINICESKCLSNAENKKSVCSAYAYFERQKKCQLFLGTCEKPYVELTGYELYIEEVPTVAPTSLAPTATPTLNDTAVPTLSKSTESPTIMPVVPSTPPSISSDENKVNTDPPSHGNSDDFDDDNGGNSLVIAAAGGSFLLLLLGGGVYIFFHSKIKYLWKGGKGSDNSLGGNDESNGVEFKNLGQDDPESPAEKKSPIVGPEGVERNSDAPPPLPPPLRNDALNRNPNEVSFRPESGQFLFPTSPVASKEGANSAQDLVLA